jgi:phenylalanine-4-hydroxylase
VAVLNLSLNVSKQMRRERIVKDRRCFDIRNAVTTSALIDDVEHVFFALRHFSQIKLFQLFLEDLVQVSN